MPSYPMEKVGGWRSGWPSRHGVGIIKCHMFLRKCGDQSGWQTKDSLSLGVAICSELKRCHVFFRQHRGNVA